LGPFTRPCGQAFNLSSGASLPESCCVDPPGHVSPLSWPGMSPYPAGYAARPLEVRPSVPFPVPFRDAGIRFLTKLFPPSGVGPLLPSAYQAPSAPGPRRGSHVPHAMRYGRGGCPLYPGGGGVPATDHGSSVAACRFSTASPWHPVMQPATGSTCDEVYEGSHTSTLPAFRLPVSPGRNG
jgi:hypothetical protein